VLRNVNARKNRGNGFALNFISTADTPVYDMAKLSDCFARENGLNGFAIQSHYTSLTNCHAYRNGTTKDHQGFLFNATESRSIALSHSRIKAWVPILVTAVNAQGLVCSLNQMMAWA
jgi:hypothetical protein